MLSACSSILHNLDPVYLGNTQVHVSDIYLEIRSYKIYILNTHCKAAEPFHVTVCQVLFNVDR
jgi:hypothetical protein